jgi:transcription elongation factor Elf1
MTENLKARCAVFPRGYLPMDCPTCGRRRLEYGVNTEGGVIYVECEKCGANSDDETLWTPRDGKPHPSLWSTQEAGS